MKKIRVLIIDDSILIREILTEILASDPQIDVVGAANDPYEARQMIKTLNPDVLTLDVEMPKMNGISFLKNLMRLRPMPVLMISTLTSEGSHITLQALELGAVDFIEKPKDLGAHLTEYRQQICQKVIETAAVQPDKLQLFQAKLAARPGHSRAEQAMHKRQIEGHLPARKLLAVGGSTGALEALRYILGQVNFTGNEALLVSLHLPGKFTHSYAQRLNSMLPLKVKEAVQGETVLQGHIYIAQGGRHMEVKREGERFKITISDAESVNLHRPSVDVLFNSLVKNAADSAAGILLTGMGKDGAQGLLNMCSAGMLTYAQDETSSVIWGMPGKAVEMGAVADEHILGPDALAQQISFIFG